MKNKICLIDLDETVVYSRREVLGSVMFKYMDEPFDSPTLMRPSAEEFLKHLSSKYRVISMTQGVVPFQKAVLAAGGLLKYFEDIYGWSDTNRISYSIPSLLDHKWVLVDNLHHMDFTLGDKVRWIREAGGDYLDPTVNFIQCQPFWGNVPEAPGDSLMSLIPTIERLLD